MHPNDEPNIIKMRTAMRKNNYLNIPDVGTELKTLSSNNVLNDKLLNLQEIATKQKADDYKCHSI